MIIINNMESMRVEDFNGSLPSNYDECFKGISIDYNNLIYMSDSLSTISCFKGETRPEKDDNQEHIYILNNHAVSNNDIDFNFQYILNVPTSPAMRIDQEPLTYMNQGQSYEVLLSQMNNHALKTLYHSVLRISFHERRMQYMEKENLEYWHRARPGERLIDIDLAQSYGLRDIKIENHLINSVEVVWDSKVACGVFVKLHCISTEFTAKKHGGEKGIPFCFSIDTFCLESGRHIHSAASQVKVFKPKGADRKHKTDREKVDRQPECERKNYQRAFDFTKLIDVVHHLGKTECHQPADSNYSVPQNRKRAGTAMTQKVRTSSCLPVPCHFNNAQISTVTSSMLSGCKSPIDNRQLDLLQAPSFDSRLAFFQSTSATLQDNCHPQQQPTITAPRLSASPEHVKDMKQECMSSQSSSASDSVCSAGSCADISIFSSSQDIVDWLHHHRFPYLIPAFQNFDAIDLLRLSRQDLVEICGLSDGVRLSNALLQRPTHPKLTLFLCFKEETVYHAVYLYSLTLKELHRRIADVFQADTNNISCILMSGPHGITIVVTSEVVRNIVNESRFIIHVLVDLERDDQYKIIFKREND